MNPTAATTTLLLPPIYSLFPPAYVLTLSISIGGERGCVTITRIHAASPHNSEDCGLIHSLAAAVPPALVFSTRKIRDLESPAAAAEFAPAADATTAAMVAIHRLQCVFQADRNYWLTL